jgi:hypothetical protein
MRDLGVSRQAIRAVGEQLARSGEYALRTYDLCEPGGERRTERHFYIVYRRMRTRLTTPVAAMMMVAVVLTASNCAKRPAMDAPADATPQLRFGSSSDVVVADSGEQRPMGASRMPRYPQDARLRNVEAIAWLAFLVDTNGRVEYPSITFLKDPPPSEFRESVCDYLRSFRLTPVVRDGRKRRALQLQPFVFALTGGGRLEGVRVDMKAEDRAVRSVPLDTAFALFEKLPHCR